MERSSKNSSGAGMGLIRTAAWGTHAATILAIEGSEYRIEAGYVVSGSTIAAINYNGAFLVKNLNPMVQTDTASKSAYISGNVVPQKEYFTTVRTACAGISSTPAKKPPAENWHKHTCLSENAPSHE